MTGVLKLTKLVSPTGIAIYKNSNGNPVNKKGNSIKSIASTSKNIKAAGFKNSSKLESKTARCVPLKSGGHMCIIKKKSGKVLMKRIK